MANTIKEKSNLSINTASETINQKPTFLEKILNDKSYNNKEKEGFRTKILQDLSNQKECGVSWSKAFVR